MAARCSWTACRQKGPFRVRHRTRAPSLGRRSIEFSSAITRPPTVLAPPLTTAARRQVDPLDTKGANRDNSWKARIPALAKLPVGLRDANWAHVDRYGHPRRHTPETTSAAVDSAAILRVVDDGEPLRA